MNEKSPALLRLLKAAAVLNSRADEVKKLIQSTNHDLEELGVGIEHWLEQGRAPVTILGMQVGDPLSFGLQLGYAKIGGTWQLAIRPVRCEFKSYGDDPSEGFTEVEVTGDPKPLVDASRIEKIAAIRHLDDLVNALAERMERLVAGLDPRERASS